jgi:hypothetical protein
MVQLASEGSSLVGRGGVFVRISPRGNEMFRVSRLGAGASKQLGKLAGEVTPEVTSVSDCGRVQSLDLQQEQRFSRDREEAREEGPNCGKCEWCMSVAIACIM